MRYIVALLSVIALWVGFGDPLNLGNWHYLFCFVGGALVGSLIEEW